MKYIEFTGSDDVRVCVGDDDGELKVCVGVPNQKAFEMPLTMWLVLNRNVAAECHKINIALHEAEDAVLH